MSSDTSDCCCRAGSMRKGKHDFMARVGDEIVVIKDVPALICDTCGEIEYTLEVSKEIDVIMKTSSRTTAGKATGGGEITFRSKMQTRQYTPSANREKR